MPYRPEKHRPLGYKTPSQRKQDHDKTRPNANARGYTYKWAKARKAYLSEHPLCVRCYDAGTLTAAAEVDHITPHKGDQVLFWDTNNWQGLCKPCHSAKTATEDGGGWQS